jgi:hypothetical protein
LLGTPAHADAVNLRDADVLFRVVSFGSFEDTHMVTELPAERQTVEVNFDGSAWQPAIFQNGQFVDVYGLPLDPQKISGWRALDMDLPTPARRHKGWVLP